ncbi:MAG: hypothetical protein WB440_02350, partial [Steroidobacteraceae bacterium]
VQIDAIAADDAIRVTNSIGGAIKGRDTASDAPLRVDTVYDEARTRLKIIITGSVASTKTLLNLISALTGKPMTQRNAYHARRGRAPGRPRGPCFGGLPGSHCRSTFVRIWRRSSALETWLSNESLIRYD